MWRYLYADLTRFLSGSHKMKYKKLITRWEYPNVTECYLFTYLLLSIDIHWTEAASGSVDILWISVSKQTDKRASTSRSGILISWWASCICCCRHCFHINLHAVCELTCSNDFRDKQGVLKLMVGARDPLCTIYRVTWYLRLLALSLSLIHIWRCRRRG